MADPLKGLLQKKKVEEQEAQAAVQSKPAVRSLFDFDVESSLGRVPLGGPSPSSSSTPQQASLQGAASLPHSALTVGEQIFQALAAGSTVDFPMVTEICERVSKEPREAPEAVRLLVDAFADRKGPARRKLKALTIMNELMYDMRAVDEVRNVHGVRDALWSLQATAGTGLGSGPDEQIRMFATEVEKKVFGSAGDPFSLPSSGVPADDPFSLIQVPTGYTPTKESSGPSMMSSLWQMGSAAVKSNLKTGLAAASEAADMLKGNSSGSSSRPGDVPKLPCNPGATRPTLEISFDGMLPGEKVHHVINQSFLVTNKPFREHQGRLLITNYRLKFQVPKGSLRDEAAWLNEKHVLDVPLGIVEEVRLQSGMSEAGVLEWRLSVDTKDFRSLMILVPSAQDLALVEEAVASMSQPGPAYTHVLFAFEHAAVVGGASTDAGWKLFDPSSDFQRMGIDKAASPWMTCPANRDYGLCSTYPAFLVQPRDISDQELRSVASFRKRGRIPVMSWCGDELLQFASLWRCSQPTDGVMGGNCHADEKLLQAIRAGRDRDLLVLDLRPWRTAYANKVGGGGFESYSGCRLKFGGIDNVHVVRDGWRKMGQAVEKLSNDEAGSWFKDVANSGWYDLIGAILNCVVIVIEELDTQHCNALIHCSDGWDRTAQVSAAVMLCMDSHYRTVRGLLVLIQKEFCSFGHRFRTRLANGDKPTNEYSPIFQQWLESVYQLTMQFPTAFEFTSELLLSIAKEALSNRYGTFLADSEKERSEKVAGRTLSFWSAILDGGPATEYVNSRYVRVEGTLRPSPNQVNFKIWEDFWFRYRVHPRDELRQRWTSR
eukprot:TRINITY_DN23740_c0_g1_i1.p1 TRINITY_DN23740_c0_g1~~TRINITY_DN23740_c0_g1_i1.p1  ORF type:complete len:837 (+),score=167.88 TRINITY_DN23740_c0_g1_i1:25-2511(+)